MITREDKAKELQEILDAETQATLGEIELNVLTAPYSLADAIRDGIKVSNKSNGWGSGNMACALSAAAIAAKAKGLL
jgi:hypothetical protein